MNKKILIILSSLLLTGCIFVDNSSGINSSSLSNSSSSINTYNSTDTSSSSEKTSTSIKQEEEEFFEDPYIGVSRSDFYSNYKEATSYLDAMYRTQHGFISGSIEYTSHIPSANALYEGNTFVKFNNYSYGYNADNEVISYDINTKDGVYKTIYKGAAYIALEEVAAYILAFGEVPPNSNYEKNKGKNDSIEKWGEYGRVNVGQYRNDVSAYPNEPELPTKDSKGNLYQYIETDFGLRDYNNGSKITRGTYRIVFTGKYKNGSNILDVNERYVFYTYNHYEDFQEYLNYYNGWGERFGYQTGNEISPTPYIEALIVDKNTL